MIDKSFVEAVQKLCVDSLPVKSESFHTHVLVRRANGEPEFIEKPTPNRSGTAHSLKCVVEAADLLHESDSSNAEVWYSDSKVEVSFSRQYSGNDNPDRVVLSLEKSKPFARLMEFAARSTPLDQRSMILELRTTFADVVRGDILTTIRGMRFTVSADDSATLATTKASIGRKIEQEVTGVNSIPDEVVFDVPVFARHVFIVQPVRCAIDVDIAAQRIRLIPLPGQLEAACEAAEEHIRKTLAELIGENAINLFCGQR